MQGFGSCAAFAIQEKGIAVFDDEEIMKEFTLGREEAGIDCFLRFQGFYIVCDEALQEGFFIRPGERNKASCF